ncbi:MAG: FtsX-like permease family protein [Thermacetogeniaceae bacterium]
MVMGVLTRKLWRNIISTRGQFLAVAAVVAVGIALYIAMTTAYANLDRAQKDFYRQDNFADYYFQAIKAPEEITRQIAALPGVIAATGRIQQDVPVIKDDGSRADARLTSFPLPMDGQVNQLTVLSGRLFDKYPQGGRIEVLLDPEYAAANHLAPGDTVNIVAGGRKVPLTVVGTATSPEFVYPMKDAASLLPEPQDFGIFMIPHNQAQEILNLPGQIDQVVVRLAPGADERQIAAQAESILEPYGNLASYPRKQQLSHAVLQAKIDGIKAMATFLPAIFLGIAALIQFVMIGRMIKGQRSQIGIMKAMGYGDLQIMLHYASYALLMGILGAGAGIVLGIFFAASISSIYAQFFNLPQAIGGFYGASIVNGIMLSTVVATAAGLWAAWGVAAIKPAESFHPEPPRGGGQIALEAWPWLWRRLDTTWKLTLRSINRNRVRSAVTMLGIVFAVGMIVVSFFVRDTVDYMFSQQFNKDMNYDYLISFARPVKEAELLNITRISGVNRAEPVFDLPVKIHWAGRIEDALILGLPLQGSMQRIFSPDRRLLSLPPDGLVIDAHTANKLGTRVGDEVQVETVLGLGPPHLNSVTILGISKQMIGSESFATLGLVNQMLQESGLVSGAMLKVDPGQTAGIEAALGAMTNVSSIVSRQKQQQDYSNELGYVFYSVFILLSFSLVLGFAIIYNASVISFAERRRELASLRVIGFTAQEISSLLLKENLLQTLVGIALGLPFGRLLSVSYIQKASTDMFTFQAVIYPLTYVLAALGGILFVIVAHRLAVRSVAALDIVEVLKTRD